MALGLVETPRLPLKSAWRALIRGLRAARRGADAAPGIRGNSDLQRILDTRLRVGTRREHIHGLRGQLAVLLAAPGAPEAAEAALTLDQTISGLIAETVTRPITLTAGGWPPRFDQESRRRLLGRDEASLQRVPPRDAAALLHRVHGQQIGGSTIRLQADLGPDEVLPPIPRDQRADRGRWGRGPPWLPHLDDVGRRSLSPRELADRTAALAGAGAVIDACCGCGGNAVAFALGGARVWAIERDPGRANLARANARAMGVGRLIEVITGSAQRHLADLLDAHPDALLFLDPPWSDGADRLVSVPELLAPLEAAGDQAGSWPRVVLKLPRQVDVTTLPGGLDRWQLRYEFGTAERGDAHIVRMIIAHRRE